MSWLFSQALVAAYLAENSSDGKPSAQLSVMPTQHLFWRNDRPMEFSRFSQFGATLKPLTEDRGADVLTWFLEAFLARTFPAQEKAQESTEQGPGCGSTWHESFARYDHVSRSWRTPQSSLLADLDEFSGTWPRWGTMRNGACSALTIAEHPTSGTASGLWPTPKATDASRGGIVSNMSRDNPALPYAIAAMECVEPSIAERERERRHRNWPTPTACMSKGTSMKSLTRRTGASRANDRLDHAVLAETFPTPCASDATKWNSMTKEERIAKGQQIRLSNQLSTPENRIGGALNPNWVEWLMGWPIGWTDLKPLETDKFQSWQQQHSASSLEGKE
jgi:hypothetical protein